MPTRLKAMRLDDEILTAFERHCEGVLRKKPTAVMQDLMLEFLKVQKAWPPKPKEGKS